MTAASRNVSDRLAFTAVLGAPAGQSDRLAAALTESGIDTFAFPLIDIEAAADSAEIDRALAEIERFSLIFFVSPNAVARAFQRATVLGIALADKLSYRRADQCGAMDLPVPSARLAGQGPLIAVIGPGSARALAAHGVGPATHRLLAPAGALEAASEAQDGGGDDVAARAAAQAIRYDSEALLNALEAIGGATLLRGQAALIVRGDGGREFFADALREAGVSVEVVAAYRRAVPTPSEASWQHLCRLLREGRHAWVLTSSEAIRNLATLAAGYFSGRDACFLTALWHTPVIVTHPRIAAAASAAGFDTITNPGAGDDNIVRAVQAIQAASDMTSVVASKRTVN